MAIKPLALPRHTTKAGADAVTIPSGEIRAEMESMELRLGDGATAGGKIIARGWRYVKEVSVTAAAQLDVPITAADLLLYDEFELQYLNISCSVDDTTMGFRLGTGAGPTYATGTGAYTWGGRLMGPSAGTDLGSSIDSETGTRVCLTRPVASAGNGLGNAAGEVLNALVRLPNPGVGTVQRLLDFRSSWVRPDGVGIFMSGGGMCGTTSAITAARLFPHTGNITGKAVLRGFRK